MREEGKITDDLEVQIQPDREREREREKVEKAGIQGKQERKRAGSHRSSYEGRPWSEDSGTEPPPSGP